MRLLKLREADLPSRLLETHPFHKVFRHAEPSDLSVEDAFYHEHVLAQAEGARHVLLQVLGAREVSRREVLGIAPPLFR